MQIISIDSVLRSYSKSCNLLLMLRAFKSLQLMLLRPEDHMDPLLSVAPGQEAPATKPTPPEPSAAHDDVPSNCSVL